MTPKEKAEELIGKMASPENIYQSLYQHLKGQMLAKQCALIAVDEILKDREVIDGMRVINDPYWLEVKQEIEKL